MKPLLAPGVAVCLLVVLATTGCSVRHTTLVPEAELSRARADSLTLDDFLNLPASAQASRRERAADMLRPVAVLEATEASAGRYIASPLLHRTGMAHRNPPALGDVIAHLDGALALDPGRADVWLSRGRLLDLAGDHHRARHDLAQAWEAVARCGTHDRQPASVRRDIAVTAAWIERDAGWWDEGLRWIDLAAADIGRDDSEAILLRGLLLAGRGHLEDAMRLSYGLPAVTLPAVCDLGTTGFLGLKKQKSDMLKRWLQAEVWMRRGEPDLAWRSLGEIPFWRRVMVIPHRFYQDLGLYAELSGTQYRANLFYALAYVRRQYRQATLPLPLASDPVINGLPHQALNFYRLGSGAFHGGSLMAYAASTTMLALLTDGADRADTRTLLAMDALETCLRRGIYPDEALALRGRLRFSRGHYVLAEMDLAEARARFAERGFAEPWTSYLLGLVAMGRDRPDEAVGLLEESLAAAPDRAGAWDALGVARLQLGHRIGAMQAFERALAADAEHATAWFNRGLLRCQEGDLDGGMADLGRAATLEPDNQEIGRLIQLARLARSQGQEFMPGLDQLGRWRPASVNVHAHEGAAFAPEAVTARDQWHGRLGEVIDDIMAESGENARASGLDAAALRQLSAEYDAAPTPQRRKLLAHALVWLDLADAARDVLAPHWGRDLDRDEVLLLLWLDQRAGEQERLRELSLAMGRDLALDVGRFDWSGLFNLLGEDPHSHPLDAGPNTFSRFDVEVRSTSYGGQYARWMIRQAIAILEGIGNRDGDMLVDVRGRAYAFPRGGGSRSADGSTMPAVRAMTAGKR